MICADQRGPDLRKSTGNAFTTKTSYSDSSNLQDAGKYS